MNEVFLLLGSDIEPRDKYLAMAEENITVSIGTITKRSEIYESEAYGFNSDKNFLNCVLLLSSKLSAEAILTQIHIIEKKNGRERSNIGYSSRTIDIDILYFNNEIIKTDYLTIPHPRLHERNFTIVPLVEIAPDFIHPILKLNSKQLLEHCSDIAEVSVVEDTITQDEL